MEDFFYQLEEVTKVGSLQSLMETMPGLSGMVKEDQFDGCSVSKPYGKM